MTVVEVNWAEHLENNRHNLVTEAETGRHNLATETETNRNNLVMEGIYQMNAESNRMQAHAAQAQAAAALKNAETNALNGSVQRQLWGAQIGVEEEKAKGYHIQNLDAFSQYSANERQGAYEARAIEAVLNSGLLEASTQEKLARVDQLVEQTKGQIIQNLQDYLKTQYDQYNFKRSVPYTAEWTVDLYGGAMKAATNELATGSVDMVLDWLSPQTWMGGSSNKPKTNINYNYNTSEIYHYKK